MQLTTECRRPEAVRCINPPGALGFPTRLPGQGLSLSLCDTYVMFQNLDFFFLGGGGGEYRYILQLNFDTIILIFTSTFLELLHREMH